MLTTISMKEEHLDDAAQLVSNRYRRLREQVPLLPNRYAEVSNLMPLLNDILKASGGGVATFDGDRLVGFLTGWKMPSFRGKRSIYSPEWANAADLDNSASIYEELYSHLAADWVADNYLAHYISLFPNDVAALRAWHWLGFGMISVDAIRGLDSIPGQNVNILIRRAELQDIEQVMELHEDLREYMKETPVFLLTEKRDRDYLDEWLQNSDKVVWMAYWKDKPVAFMRLGPADKDECTIIVDEKTTSIYAAFTKEEVRKEGFATALLDQALRAARASGYERCSVPFEPMNLLGTRFWLKYFKPVCFSLVRYIDERVKEK